MIPELAEAHDGPMLILLVGYQDRNISHMLLWRSFLGAKAHLEPLYSTAPAPSGVPLSRLSRLLLEMSAINAVVQDSSWILLGWTPLGVEIWLGTSDLWLNGPPDPRLIAVSVPQVLSIASSSPLPAPPPQYETLPVLTRLDPECEYSIPSWLPTLIGLLGWNEDVSSSANMDFELG